MKTKFIMLLMASLLSTSAFADKAIFAGGCFWCMESDFEKLTGVTEVISGFTGGTIENPTYNGNHQGHYEAVEVTYDPEVISYQSLLVNYWINIDPFDDSGQFCDKGPSYRTAIFVADDYQKELAEKSREQVVKNFPDKEVVTPILDASTFYPIKGEESYHQDYYKNYSTRYKFYRWNCGRDQRLQAIWGDKHSSH
jgi:peptide-methionine (S)-S-oxide reductase